MCIQTHIDENQCRVNLSGVRTVKSRMCGRRTVMLRSGIAVILALSSLPGQCDVNGVVTATFENYVFHDSSGYTGTWLGRVPVTDPLSGITLSCPGGSVAGPCTCDRPVERHYPKLSRRIAWCVSL